MKYGYVGFYNQSRCEVYAESSFQAQRLVAEKLHVKPKNMHKISVVLAETDGVPVVHSTAAL